jgi:hypothetical protein
VIDRNDMFHSIQMVRKILTALLLMILSQAAQAVLSGEYTVGDPGSDYPTISAAVSALNSQGISGPVDFILATGTYDEQVTVQNFTRSGSVDDEVTFRKFWAFNKVNWKYSSANSAGNNFVVKLAGATFVNFRGIHFQAVISAAPYGNLLVLSDGAANISISGAQFTGLAEPGFDSGSLVYQTGAGGNSNLEIISNTFTNGYRAIDMNLVGSDLSGLLVDSNTFTGQQWGAVISNSSGAIITNNEVEDVASSNPSYSAMLISDDSATIEANVIDIQKGNVAIANLADSGAALAGSVSNNMISTVNSGIEVSASNTSIYQNTVSGSVFKQALRVFGTPVQVRIRNNILTHDGSGGAVLAVESGVSIESSNYNNIFSSGGVPLVTFGGSDYSTLADYQVAKGLDTDSVSVTVSYLSDTRPFNLHLAEPSASSTDLVAPVLADIPKDVDGQTRFTPFTFMGADEGATVVTPPPSEPLIFQDGFE